LEIAYRCGFSGLLPISSTLLGFHILQVPFGVPFPFLYAFLQSFALVGLTFLFKKYEIDEDFHSGLPLGGRFKFARTSKESLQYSIGRGIQIGMAHICSALSLNSTSILGLAFGGVRRS
jgi:hypothetical protein